MVLPLFDYCAVVWDSCGQGSTSYLDKLNRRAACIIEERAVKSDERSTISGWPHFNFPKCILVYKCINGIAPSYLRGEFGTLTNSTPIPQVISYGYLWPNTPNTRAVFGLTVRVPTILSSPILESLQTSINFSP